MKISIIECGWLLTKIAIIIYKVEIQKYIVIDGRNRVSIMKKYIKDPLKKRIKAYILDHTVDIPKVIYFL